MNKLKASNKSNRMSLKMKGAMAKKLDECLFIIKTVLIEWV